MIAAIGEHRELGKDNKLIFDIPEDMQHFRETTRGHAVIMGRKTFESIGRPLPKRTNIVISRNIEYLAEGCTVVDSLENALAYARTVEHEEIFIIGGGQIYTQGIAFADRLYLTVVKGTYDCDSYFPEYLEFSNVVTARDSRDERYQYTFYVLEKSAV